VTTSAFSGGGTSYDYLHGVAVDGAGAVVAAGYFQSSAATFGDVVLTNAGSYDAVLWKLNAEGTTLWAVRGGGTSSDRLQSVAVDSSGGVVAAGYFQSSTATFGGVALTNAGSGDAVVWKQSAEGTTLWVVRGGGSSWDTMPAVAVDGAGGVVAAGNFGSSPATFGNLALTPAGGYDAVLWKMNAEGTTLWAARGGGTSYEYMLAVAVDGAGAVVAAGYFQSSAATFGDVALTTAGGNDAFLWKLNAEGTTLWALRGGGAEYDYMRAVTVDGTGAVVAAGTFSGTTATFGGVALINAGATEAVLWKVSGEGTTLWAVRGGGESSDELQAVAVDGAGAVVAAGQFSSPLATFGFMVLNTTGTGNNNDGVLWKVNAEGTTLWALRGGGTSSDYLYGVAMDGTGGVVAAGYFQSSPATFGDEALTTVGGGDALLWKVSDVEHGGQGGRLVPPHTR